MTPKHTVESAARTIVGGLRDGSIVLGGAMTVHERELVEALIGKTPAVAVYVRECVEAERKACAAAARTVLEQSPPGTEPLGFHAGCRAAASGIEAAILSRG